jgi:hypothetical protein
LFMAFASEFLDQSWFRSTEWLQQWKAFWQEHKQTHGNGCSNIDVEGYLISPDRLGEFRAFIPEYRAWLTQTFGEFIESSRE